VLLVEHSTLEQCQDRRLSSKARIRRQLKMATKQKPPSGKKRPTPPTRPFADETVRVKKWRQEQFVSVLRAAGLTDEKIDLKAVKELVESTASPHDLKKLIEKGCDPEIAIRILA
jgi:hypothetical protein